MKYCSTITFATLASTVLAAYVPSDPWTGLTPDSPAPTGASTDHTHAFGIQIVLVAASSGAAKRAIDQITDGQVQANSATLATPSPTTAAPIQQIGDGQIQHQTTAAPIQQIGDGQIQHQTTAVPIQQIGDGQIQHQTTAAPIQQIGDGQIQHQTTVSGIQQISDGQIQNPTGTAAAQISDGQVQQTGAPASDDGTPQACGTDTTLSMSISGGILTDSKGRIGAIVANRQFQFDGPPPQAGTIYAAGWSITSDGYLALGDSTQFYQCLSGDFYNLYDQNVADQCTEVKLSIVDLVTC